MGGIFIYQMNDFDIFGQIAKEIESFKDDRIHIAGLDVSESARYLTRRQKGYDFSQREVLNLIDLYYNSKFETGNIDSEGQRKLFLNICAFRSDVASKMIDLDTKDFVFIPDDQSSKWTAFFIQKEFKDWARKNYFGDLINDLVENFPRYGTVVVKKVGKKLERVPLKNLVNQQDAKDLATATYVIELHDNMTLDDMKSYKDWDTTGLDMKFGETTTVYERYGRVPASFYYEYNNQAMPESEKNNTYDCLIICTLEPNEKKTKYQGTILFLEKVTERPYLEVHWKRQDGRWLGIGEIENQFENQISRNMIANLRRRALLWSSKKVFQSPDDTIAKNLVRDVKDGDVIRIMPNGNITQVDMASREIGEFSSTEELWEKNSDQKSFTYEVATGESMPSGTPFRLGVVLANAVNSHFGLKKEKLGLFLKKIIVEFVFEIFKKENSKEHTITLFGTEDGIQDLKKVCAEIHYNQKITEWAMSDSAEVPNFELWKQMIEQSYNDKSHMFIEIPDKFYDEAKTHVELVITGEEIDTNSKIQTLTTLYQSLVQSGDPRAQQVLSKIMTLTGDNLEAILGPSPAQQPKQQLGKGGQPSSMPQIPNQPVAPQV